MDKIIVYISLQDIKRHTENVYDALVGFKI